MLSISVSHALSFTWWSVLFTSSTSTRSKNGVRNRGKDDCCGIETCSISNHPSWVSFIWKKVANQIDDNTSYSGVFLHNERHLDWCVFSYRTSRFLLLTTKNTDPQKLYMLIVTLCTLIYYRLAQSSSRCSMDLTICCEGFTMRSVFGTSRCLETLKSIAWV